MCPIDSYFPNLMNQSLRLGLSFFHVKQRAICSFATEHGAARTQNHISGVGLAFLRGLFGVVAMLGVGPACLHTSVTLVLSGSSCTLLNMYTTGRDVLLPEGLQCRGSVRLGNLLARRTGIVDV